ncbi:DUF6514 family protein [uncultured Dysosmobacter sp.]|uniref:DUF6514 family protein n=1 Tax=uncultured Dysosmobacter sp. TaxID=2591384 RepID=UPI002629DB01|nr:DUF6514 family protein [uncultured Dysosmobacter sp.]
MFQYLPVEMALHSPYFDCGRTFGLRVLRVENGQDEEVMLLPDVSTDFSFVLHLADIFTRKQLDPIHLLDVIEDSI